MPNGSPSEKYRSAATEPAMSRGRRGAGSVIRSAARACDGLLLALRSQAFRLRLLDGDRVPRRFQHESFLQREVFQRLIGERFLLVLLHLDLAGVQRVARDAGAAGGFFAL